VTGSERSRPESTVDVAVRRARRIITFVVGGSVVALGAALLVLPGPGLLFLMVGLGILATEFAWARWLLRRARAGLTGARRWLRSNPRRD
jgi:tellurite resistance protein TerC